MSKFNTRTTGRPPVTSPIQTTAAPVTTNHFGGDGYARDAKGELFLLAVANMVGQNTFYEKSDARDARFDGLVREVTRQDPGWMLRFIKWLRAEANMRSASIVAAVEAVKERTEHYAAVERASRTGERVQSITMSSATDPASVSYSRAIIDAALQRADEPGELLALWTSRYGRAIPKPVKRGVADAVDRLYTERSLLKYDTASHGFRFGDVLDLTHPTAKDPWQGALYRYALDRRHGRDDLQQIVESLPMVYANIVLRSKAADRPEVLLDAEALKAAGMTWEDALSLAGSKVDKAKLWEALIPSMGIMALARNLRNFDQAGVSDKVAAQVIARFTDAEQVAKSRMFPFRWLAAYRTAPSLRWGHALDQALTASLANVPALPGRTLVLVDQSPSMFPEYGYYSKPVMSDMSNADAAKVFGAAVAMRAEAATLVQYGGASEPVQVPKGGSLLRLLDQFHVIDSTDTFGAMRRWFDGHDRVMVVTDEQTGRGVDPVPATVPVYTWNVGGYQYGHGPAGRDNRHTFGGMTDQAFRLIPLLEARRSATWPF